MFKIVWKNKQTNLSEKNPRTHFQKDLGSLSMFLLVFFSSLEGFYPSILAQPARFLLALSGLGPYSKVTFQLMLVFVNFHGLLHLGGLFQK